MSHFMHDSRHKNVRLQGGPEHSLEDQTHSRLGAAAGVWSDAIWSHGAAVGACLWFASAW